MAVRGGVGGTGAPRARGVASPRGMRGDDAGGLGRVQARRGSLAPRDSPPAPGCVCAPGRAVPRGRAGGAGGAGAGPFKSPRVPQPLYPLLSFA